MMRIITGTARGTHLFTLTGEATRPTSERAKEALFSMLQQEARPRRVLDLFAGSGQLGLEALSRGADCAVFVDGSKEAAAVVRRNAEKTRLQDRATVRVGDALSFLRGCRTEPFDLVFLDPPYAAGLLPPCLSLLIQKRLLTPNAIIVTESASPEDVFAGDTALAAKFEIRKQSRYGVAHICIMTPAKKE